MEKKNPIKFFAKREMDDSRTEAGGGNPPAWVLSGSELIEKSGELTTFLNKLESKFDERTEKFIPITIKAKLNDKATAKTHRGKVEDLFSNKSNSSNLIGMSGEDEVIIKIPDKIALKTIEKKVGDYSKNSYGISCIDDIEIFKPTIVSGEKENEEYKIRLLNYYDSNLNEAIENSFKKQCMEWGINIERKRYSDELIIYKGKSINIDNIAKLEKKIYIHSIKPMPKYEVKLDILKGEPSSVIKKPIEGEKYTTVGILDSGIERIKQLEPWIEGDRMTSYPNDLIDTSHGTFVAGVILYGDVLEDKEYTSLKGCRIFDGNIFPDLEKENVTEDELIDNIRDIIEEKYEDVKIWNLSGGLQEEIDDNEFSDFGIALDSIQDEFGVIICKSASNCENFLKGEPKQKIAKSADSVRAITVGSIAHKKGKNDIAEVDYPSPFTRIGRGPGYIIKPELVHYGGNAGCNNGKICVSGVKSFDKVGNIVENVGTSFSTPRVTALLAALDNEIEEEFDPLLLKALAIHSANYGEQVKLSESDKLQQLGYGTPKNAKNILYNDENEITLIMRDTLEKGTFMEILDFPFPESLKKNGFYTGQIITTLVYNPILDGNQASEYCQSNINVYFGSYDNKVERDTSKRTILNPIGKKNSQNIFSNGLYSKVEIKNPKTRFGRSERMLISYGDKYYPVKKYAVDLNEMTNSNKEKFLFGNKKWFLKLTGNYRKSIENEYERNSLSLSQEFCLIITIKDPNKTVPVYDEVTRLLDFNNFWHNNIKLSQNVNVNINL
ncbi:S8 family peptidase [Clostridium perfringens]|uniref:S8 family peptidase n=1 Tax=Clostridium perfringens TaxID=1502 RepID=UPI00374FB037|nr:S8 family peptidase [Clostridium perfringens]